MHRPRHPLPRLALLAAAASAAPIPAATGVAAPLPAATVPTTPAPAAVAPAPAAADDAGQTRPAVDAGKLAGTWRATYKVAGKDRTLTHTFDADGTFQEHDSNWGRNWGTWRLDGDTLHLKWTVRGGFSGRMKVLSLTDKELVVRFPADSKTERTYARQ